jgi:hypothetical protein
MDKDFIGTDDFEGECYIDLAVLEDQQNHEIWVDLEPPPKKRQKWSGKVLLNMQWLYSETDYLSDYLSKWDDKINQSITEKKEIETHLKSL